MEYKVKIWDKRYRLLSTPPTSFSLGTRWAAILELFNEIAEEASNIVYLNQIYDNAQVELKQDNMVLVTVQDHFAMQDLYVKSRGSGDGAPEFTFAHTNSGPVGFMYTKKTLEGPEPEFQQALNAFNEMLTERVETLRKQIDEKSKKMAEKKIVDFDKAKAKHGGSIE